MNKYSAVCILVLTCYNSKSTVCNKLYKEPLTHTVNCKVCTVCMIVYSNQVLLHSQVSLDLCCHQETMAMYAKGTKLLLLAQRAKVSCAGIFHSFKLGTTNRDWFQHRKLLRLSHSGLMAWLCGSLVYLLIQW